MKPKPAAIMEPEHELVLRRLKEKHLQVALDEASAALQKKLSAALQAKKVYEDAGLPNKAYAKALEAYHTKVCFHIINSHLTDAIKSSIDDFRIFIRGIINTSCN